MTVLSKIESLPDYIDSMLIKEHFINCITEFKDGQISKEIFIECLYQLSDRQWHTYELIDPDIKEKIEAAIIDCWEESISFQDSISGIVGMLGLEKIYELIRNLYTKNNISLELKNILNETINEFGNSVSNPYKDMRTGK